MEEVGCPSLETLLADGELRGILDVHVNMVDAHGSLKEGDVLGVADLDEDFSAAAYAENGTFVANPLQCSFPTPVIPSDYATGINLRRHVI